MSRIRWKECDYCFLVTSDLGRHMQIAHNVRQRVNRQTGNRIPQGFAHLPKGECFYCAHWESITSDHVLPMRLGREFNRAWNRVPACVRCNSKKADALPSAWFASLIADDGQAYAHGPKYRAIIERVPVLVDALLERPELARYPT